MAKTKLKLKKDPTDEQSSQFAVGYTIKDMQKPVVKTINTDLFSSANVHKIIDSYEEQMGIKNTPPPETREVFKNIMLSPGYDEDDKAEFNKLLNNPELYRIVKMTETWTARGEFKIFIIYAENQTEKEKRQDEALLTGEKEPL